MEIIMVLSVPVKNERSLFTAEKRNPCKFIKTVKSYRCKNLRPLQEFSSPIMAVKTMLRKQR